MLRKNSELRAAARAALSGKWVMAAIATVVLSAISSFSSFLFIFAVLVIFPLMYGYSVLLLNTFRGEDINIGTLFDGFNDFGRIFTTKLLVAVYTFLWTLLFFIPGIIKGYSYAMTDFILKDEPALSNNAAIEKSMAMMSGHKMKLFLLDLSFIGWAILCMLFTFGIGFFWLRPYMATAYAAFYEDLRADRAATVVE